ncbi:MAG: di-trans,poly-cis-decaprenylcistransferase [Halieaceae bacterium]|nr:di-trans,poly-cis-decaprenylcistransferase [Halieaceae bacterium]
MQASDIQLRSVPRHLAIIMDGNNRWARREGYPGVAGHRAGAEVVREIVSACETRGIRYLTLFAFSSENWGRPRAEVRALLALLSRYLRNEVEKLARDGVRLRVIGRRDRFSPRLQKLIAEAEAATEAGDRATLTLALDYGGRWDVAEVTRSIAQDVAEGKLNPADIDEEAVSQRLATAQLPDPDLCIRTAGEARISNFLLWQFAYAEFWFTEVLWPDFDETVLDLALADYAVRERRFGVRPLLHHY